MDKGSGSGIFPDPDTGDPKRPDPTGTGSGSATPIYIFRMVNSKREQEQREYISLFSNIYLYCRMSIVYDLVDI